MVLEDGAVLGDVEDGLVHELEVFVQDGFEGLVSEGLLDCVQGEAFVEGGEFVEFGGWLKEVFEEVVESTI